MSQAEGALGGQDAAYRRGVVMVMAAGVLWSLAGLAVRSMEEAGAWQILFVRSTAVALTVLAVLLWRYRGDCLRNDPARRRARRARGRAARRRVLRLHLRAHAHHGRQCGASC